MQVQRGDTAEQGRGTARRSSRAMLAHAAYSGKQGIAAVCQRRLTLARGTAQALPPCCEPAPSYNAPMLDIKLIRERPDFVRQRLATRGAGDEARIDEVLKLDEQRRKLLGEVEALKAQRKRVSKEIGALMGQKKIAEAEAKKKETGDLGDRIAALDKQAAEAEAARNQLMLRLPNLPHESVPVGKSAEDNPVVRVHGREAGVRFQAEVARRAVRELAAGGFHARGQARGQRVCALHELGREAGAGVDPVHARPAHERARLHRGVAAVHGRAAMPGRRGPVPEVRRPVLRGAGRAGREHAGQAVSHPDGRDAGGQHPPGGDSEGERAADSLLRLHAVLSRGGRARRASARAA